jgi:hypothetical protein
VRFNDEARLDHPRALPEAVLGRSEMSSRFYDVFTIRDGTIARLEEYHDARGRRWRRRNEPSSCDHANEMTTDHPMRRHARVIETPSNR